MFHLSFVDLSKQLVCQIICAHKKKQKKQLNYAEKH